MRQYRREEQGRVWEASGLVEEAELRAEALQQPPQAALGFFMTLALEKFFFSLVLGGDSESEQVMETPDGLWTEG